MCSTPANTSLDAVGPSPPGSSAAGRSRGSALGIRTWLLLLLAAACIPFLLVQAGMYYGFFRSQRATDLQANLELARAVSTAFGTLVADVLHQEATIGRTLTLWHVESPQQAEELLSAAIRSYPCVRHLSWLSPGGRVLASSAPGLAGADLAAHPTADEVIHGREWSVSDLFADPLSGQPSFAISHGIRDGRGALLCIVVAVIDPDDLEEALPIARGGGGAIGLIDGGGRYIYRSPWGGARPGDPAAEPPSLLANALAGHEETAAFRPSPRGPEWLAGLTPVVSTSWLAEAQRPAAEVAAPLIRGLLRDAWLLLLAGLGALAVAIIVGQRFIDPILSLHKQALIFGRGERTSPIEPTGPAETRDLAIAFDRMAQEIGAREEQSARLLREVQDANQRLEASEARYRSLFETALDGILVASDDGCILEVNPQASELTGYTQQELLGMGFLELIPVELHARAIELYKEFCASGRMQGELMLRHSQGRLLQIEAQAVRIAPFGFQVAFRDIGARKEATDERERLLARVHRQAAELDATIASIPVGIVIVDRTGAIVRMNAAAWALLGHTPEELGMSLPERAAAHRVVRPDGRAFAIEELPVSHALRGETVQGVVAVARRPGTETWLMIGAAPVSAADGKLLGAVVSCADVTTMHELQEQREDILGMVSHDLRGPLTVVHGQAELLLRWLARADLTGREQRSAEAILASARRMNVMIQDLVDAARLESGQLHMDALPLDLYPFVMGIVEQMASTVESKRIEVEEARDLPPVLADTDRVERILTNLLSNALKYSPPESRVTVSFGREPGFVVTSVADRGQGIAPEEMPHLGQRYYRTLTARSRREGLGLGLYICRLLVEALGGRLWVHSEMGIGSTFFFSLPVAE